MLPPTEDPRKLEITLRHYEEENASQAVKIAGLQAEIVRHKANIDHLEECLTEERAQRTSESAPTEVRFSARFRFDNPLTGKHLFVGMWTSSQLRPAAARWR